MPVDLWVLPWKNIVNLESAYKIIFAKFSKVLKVWKPRDRSAIEILRAWRYVEPHWSMMIEESIVPKLIGQDPG